MMSVMLTQAYRGGHPIDEVDSQSFKANRPVLMHRCCRLGFTQHHTPPLTRPRNPHRPSHRATPVDLSPLPPPLRPHSQPAPTSSGRNPAARKIEVSSVKPMARGTWVRRSRTAWIACSIRCIRRGEGRIPPPRYAPRSGSWALRCLLRICRSYAQAHAQIPPRPPWLRWPTSSGFNRATSPTTTTTADSTKNWPGGPRGMTKGRAI